MKDFEKFASAFNAAIGDGQVTGFSNNKQIFVLLNDAPDQLRQIADLVESMALKEIKAVVAYPRPSGEILPLTVSSTEASTELDELAESDKSDNS